MKYVIKNVKLPQEYGFGQKSVCVAVCGDTISSVTEEMPEGKFDRVIDGKNNLLSPGFYNTHCHAAMTLFRGYGEDLPLQKWLNERILPAEDRLTNPSVYWGTMLSIAEMIASGVVSFSDMYFFEDQVGKAVLETGVKANISRCIVSFDPSEDPESDYRFAESKQLVKDYHMAGDGRLMVDMALHAEYTNTERMSRAVAEYAAKEKLRIQLHLSETAKEHRECGERHGGKTPLAFFRDAGVLENPVIAAHCVWVSDEDMDIMREKGVFVAHNPVSNLKLGSGVMAFGKMAAKGLNLSLGTDGPASNNNQSMLKEMQYAAILHKGVSLDPTTTLASQMIGVATRGGALAQGRENCGRIEPGFKADLVLWNLDSIHNIPSYGYDATLVYSAQESDVLMTMCDGRILYENGEYTTIDVEKMKYMAKDVIAHYFD